MEGGYRATLEKFTGDNYYLWKHRLKALLAVNNCNGALSLLDEDASVEVKAKHVADGKKVLNYISLCLGERQTMQTMSAKTAYEAIQMLDKIYLSKDSSNRLSLLQALFSIRMTEGADFPTHLFQFESLLVQLTATEYQPDESIMCAAFSASLPEGWQDFTSAVTASLGAKIKFKSLKDALYAEDHKRKNRGASIASPLLGHRANDAAFAALALPAHSPPVSGTPARVQKPCIHCSKTNHRSEKCWAKFGKPERDSRGDKTIAFVATLRDDPPPPSPHNSQPSSSSSPSHL